MVNTSSGQILVADYHGIQVIKMVGDVRLTFCVSFDQYSKQLFCKSDFDTVLFDLSETEGMDSTTLGMVAKIALKMNATKAIKPTIICHNKDLLRLLSSMSIDTICDVVDNVPEDHRAVTAIEPLPSVDSAFGDKEGLVKEKVLEAHYALMDLSESNRETFKDLVNTLDGHYPSSVKR